MMQAPRAPRAVNYKLTDRKIQGLKPKTKPYAVTDGCGLHLEVATSGSKVWRYAYMTAGKRGKVSIGAYPGIGITQARDEHRRLIALIAKGIDPMRQRKLDAIEATASKAQEQTFKDFGEIWVSQELASVTDRTRKQAVRWLANDVYPAIGALPLGEVHASDVRDLLESLRNTPTKATVVQSVLERIFKYAAQKLLITVNPATAMQGLVKRPKSVSYRPLAVVEIAPFVQSVRTCNAHIRTRLAVELLLLTVVRKDNVCKARWEHIDLDSKTWTIPGRTVGGNGFMKMPYPHTVYLTKQAVGILQQAKQLSGNSDWVFPTVSRLSEPMAECTINHLFSRLKADGSCPVDFAPHGLRSTFSTLANEEGIAPDVVEAVLSHHEKNAVRAAYNRAQYAKPATTALQWYSDRIDSIVKGASIHQLRAA